VGEVGVLSHNCEVAQLGRKLDYLFGKATGEKNLARTADMKRQLASIGIFDSAASRNYLTNLLNGALNNESSIVGYSPNGNTIREFLIAGPNGAIKAESYWEGTKLITVKLFGSGR
jgi:hypothetical protein